ncbi:hypothetical protein QF032_001952 [Streptomyces achromogenes]|uniref:hypothetical protein n=1 Tax=Streptomyces achromogenes TaxID=67255 RepID=UPI002786A3D2|nr:hypothetical protein [Streptomyces achromogenes]MDQ0830108.1 hypothetical protein [Streptomyces achromogenes]
MELSARTLLELPGVRRQVDRITADLAAGLHCLWLLPDDLVDGGYAEELHRAALYSSPERLDIPAPSDEETAASSPSLEPGSVPAGRSWDDLPVLADYDDGFDIGWAPELPRQRTAPQQPTDVPEGPESGLLARLAKELSVTPGEAIDTLTDPGARWRPVIGVRAWKETATAGGPAAPERDRGHDVARLIRALGAAAKQAGLPPENRPRLLVTARIGDLPSQLPDELERDLASSAVHWWWDTLDRLDSATVVAAVGARGARPGRRHGELLRDRILRAVRDEVISEVCGPDLVLGWRLARRWDGSQRTLQGSLWACLDVGGAAPAVRHQPVHLGVGSGHRPPARLRPVWARGLIQSWDGRARVHPAVWRRDGSAPDQLRVLVSQAQARILLPWIEDTRQRLAPLALGGVTGPVADLVARYVGRLPAEHRENPEEAFRTIEVGPMLTACRQGHLNLARAERQLLEQLVLARNVLSHRGVLFDRTLHALCDELAQADHRWSGDE